MLANFVGSCQREIELDWLKKTTWWSPPAAAEGCWWRSDTLVSFSASNYSEYLTQAADAERVSQKKEEGRMSVATGAFWDGEDEMKQRQRRFDGERQRKRFWS